MISLSDQLEQLGISRLHTETDAVASRFLHQFQGFAIHRIDPRKGAPGEPEPPPKDLAADLLDSAAVGNKEIVGHIDPVYPVSEYLLYLIDDTRGGPKANAIPHHPSPLAEDAGIGTAAARDDADRIAEGLIP